MLEYLSDSLVKASASLVILPLVLIVLLAAVVVLIDWLTRARRDVVVQEKYRYERYEAGNPPPKSDARGKVSMQYLGYLIVFLAVEPALVVLAILLAAPRTLLGDIIKLYAVLIAVYAPLLAYALRWARRVQSWMLEG